MPNDIEEYLNNGIKELLKFAYALHFIRQEGLWSDSTESFRDFVEELGLPFGWGQRLIACALLWAEYPDIPPVRLVMLTGKAEKTNLTKEIIEASKVVPIGEFQNMLRKTRKTDHKHQVDCPHCGSKLIGVRYVSETKEEVK